GPHVRGDSGTGRALDRCCRAGCRLQDEADSGRSARTMKSGSMSLAELSVLAPRDFVFATYDAILGRPPTSSEQHEMLSALMRGDARTWLVGRLRYGAEGRSRGADV